MAEDDKQGNGYAAMERPIFEQWRDAGCFQRTPGFGGGGHVLASGCMIFGSLEEVLDKLTYAVYQNL